MFRRIRLLKKLQKQLEGANALSEAEAIHLEKVLEDTFKELITLLCPYNNVKVGVGVPTIKSRKTYEGTWSYMGATK